MFTSLLKDSVSMSDRNFCFVTVCLFVSLPFATPASASGHAATSSDGEGLGSFELALFQGTEEPAGNSGGTPGELAVSGNAPFSGSESDTDEAELSAEGAELEGIEGEVSEQDLAHLLSLKPAEETVETRDGAEVILDADTRVRLYTTSYPARAAVLVTFSGGRCSGFMIGNNTVATAGHCVHSGGSYGSWRTNVRVYPGFDGTSAPFGSCTARRLYSVTGWTVSRNEEYDYGAIKLNCTVGNATGWFGFRTGAGNDTPSIVTGYPGDKPLEMWQSSDKIRYTSQRQLFYANDTLGGMSGSAVWEDWWTNNQSHGPYVNAIHAYGTHGSSPHATYNHGTKINSAVFNNLLSWKNAP